MNQRIKQLAELCYEVKPSLVENSQKIGNDGVPLYREVFNQEKFAELIVRECMKVADDRYQTMFPSEVIAKHFGVK
jgi:glutathione peroxidase-family protein